MRAYRCKRAIYNRVHPADAEALWYSSAGESALVPTVPSPANSSSPIQWWRRGAAGAVAAGDVVMTSTHTGRIRRPPRIWPGGRAACMACIIKVLLVQRPRRVACLPRHAPDAQCATENIPLRNDRHNPARLPSVAQLIGADRAGEPGSRAWRWTRRTVRARRELEEFPRLGQPVRRQSAITPVSRGDLLVAAKYLPRRCFSRLSRAAALIDDPCPPEALVEPCAQDLRRVGVSVKPDQSPR